MVSTLFRRLARRRVLTVVAGVGVILAAGFVRAADGTPTEKTLEVAQAKLLSEHGSTRAARYASTNKIVTLAGKTHVAWLDSVSNTMIATYDHASGEWGPAVRVGTGTDNHGGPALTCDRGGHLHVIFGPHGDVPFQHCRSARPHDATEWIKLDGFGHHPTYPSAVCDEEETLHVIYRGGTTRGHPHKLLYQRKPKNGAWSDPRALVEAPSDWKSYTHYHASIAISAQGTLHVAYDIYYNGAAKRAGHMTSRDRGRTWTLADGAPLDLPVGIESDAFFARTDAAFKVLNVVCDSHDRPWIALGDARTEAGPTVFHHDGQSWRSFCPGKLTSPPIDVGELGYAVSLTLDRRDGIYVATTLGTSVTGGVHGRVVLLHSNDGGRHFRCVSVFPPDPQLPHTGLSLERRTGHHLVDAPWLLFSTGEKGPDCFGRGIYHRVHAVQFRTRSGTPPAPR